MSRLFALYLLPTLLLLAGTATLFAQPPAPAAPPVRLWVESYGLVLLCLVLGAALLLRPGTREEPKV